ncbi:terminase endonuclease subunit [Actinobacillus seminis]|uniref:phage terminase small subunit n=1 Tax=Actinobacillus seminis TaxID=722 RepID=UPI003B944915
MGMREFQQRHNALQAVSQVAPSHAVKKAVVAQYGSDYSVLEIALKNDVNVIRALPTLELRAEMKRDKFLPHWLPFVDEYFTKGVNYQNDIVGYCIVYLFDVGDFERALSLADKAIAQGQSLPERFNSTLPHFVADQVYKWAEKQAGVGLSVEPYFTQTFKNVAKVWQLHEIVVAKWLKLAAALLLRTKDGQVQASGIDDPEKIILAINLCNRAYQLNYKAGVKTLIERSLMRLNALEQAGIYHPNEFSPVVGLSLEPVQIDVEAVVRKLCADPLLTRGDHV